MTENNYHAPALPGLTTIEKNILWMLVQNKLSCLDMAVNLSVSVQEVEEALAALIAKTGSADLRGYALRAAQNWGIGIY